MRPRVWFGERWITSIFDLFEENVRYFPALLPVVEDEDPMAVLESGGAPKLQELRLHNGTIYRWNRPIYDISRGRPHLRVENRVLPAGPTIVDTLANAAFYYGLVRVLVEDERPVWTPDVLLGRRGELLQRRQGRHRRARCTGPASARPRRPSSSCAGCCRWPATASRAGASTRPTPTACSRSSSAAACEQVNGASWQAAAFHRLYDRLDRADALREMTVRYREHMHSNEPVHTWPLPT